MPVTIEFLVSFAATLGLIFILASALSAQHAKIVQSISQQQEISKAKKAARAVETWLNNGKVMPLDFRDENISFRLEERFLVDYDEKTIEVEGVFIDDEAEPV